MRPLFLKHDYARVLNLVLLILSLIFLASIAFAVTLWIGKGLGYDEYERLHGVRHTEKLVQPTLQVGEGECREIQKLRARMEKIRGKG